MRWREHPTHASHNTRKSYNALEAYTTTKMKRDGVLGWQNEEVEECVINSVNEKRIVDERQKSNWRREDLSVQDIIGS